MEGAGLFYDRQVSVIDLEAEAREGGAIDATAVAAPDAIGVPASIALAFVDLGGDQLLFEGLVPGVPGGILIGEEGEGGVVPVVEIDLFGAGEVLEEELFGLAFGFR